MPIYADDIQLIIKIPVNSINSNLELLECASEIINYLLRNYLLVNTSKTELLNVSRVYTNFPPVIIDGRVIILLLQFVILELSSILHYLLMLTLVPSQNLLTSIYIGLVIL